LYLHYGLPQDVGDMHALSILGILLGVTLLLMAIPQIDVARSGIATVVSSPIATFVSILVLVMVVSVALIAVVFALSRS